MDGMKTFPCLLPLLVVSFGVSFLHAEEAEITAALPSIPDAKFNLADFGAKADSKSLNTEAFQKAVAAIAKAGGGHLIVPAGTYRTTSFELTSHMDLHLEAGAVIKGSEKFADYGIPDPNEPLPATSATAMATRQQRKTERRRSQRRPRENSRPHHGLQAHGRRHHGPRHDRWFRRDVLDLVR